MTVGDPSDVTFEEGPCATPNSYVVRVTVNSRGTTATIEASLFCGKNGASRGWLPRHRGGIGRDLRTEASGARRFRAILHGRRGGRRPRNPPEEPN